MNEENYSLELCNMSDELLQSVTLHYKHIEITIWQKQGELTIAARCRDDGKLTDTIRACFLPDYCRAIEDVQQRLFEKSEKTVESEKVK